MPIQLDSFQEQAIEWIEKEHSVLVSAPTGAGKTLIAECAIDKALSRNENVIYTAPIKALSNQKYRDFRALYGEGKVGLLTGDVSIHVDAPIVIMTTEIYRNSLFSATNLGGSAALFGGENTGRIQKVGWVIFDEIHYLDDPERGTVWEEALLFTPLEIRILALSATAPNIKQLAEWIKLIHERPIAVVEEMHRPVPLEFLFQCQGRIMDNMARLKQEGYFNREDWRLSPRDRRRGVRPLRAKPNRLDHLLWHLIDKEKLPAIYFVFGRRRTEILAGEAGQFNFLSPEEYKQIRELYQTLLEKYDLTRERSADELRPLVERGIAYHHAGMLPTLKEVVEQLFTSRLIKVIFTTETFALGINMPARSVIFDELEKFYGTRFHHLTTRDFYQMAGRAGRRGMDERGFVYIRIHPNDITIPEISRIIHGKPEAIRSQLNTTYATLLNLYRDLGRKLLDIYPRTFHYFQSSDRNRREGYQSLERKLSLLEEMGYLTPHLPPPILGGGKEGGLTPKGEFAASLFGYELLLAEMHDEGILDALDEAKLNVLLSALIFEPRKGDHPVRLSSKNEAVLREVERFFRNIHRRESKYRIFPYTKPPHFNLAPVVEAWTQGESFEKLFRLTHTDEGELVRHFRMVIQLLKDLANAPNSSERLCVTARNAFRLINRGVVDAEKQLRV
ncbi:MAG: DEAD/DEAH box helicase [Candidatus Omnitrophica bacterium]|nr:DEAD/DEAH box helicase [Candidatus Omnitrophota bacterium]